MRKMKGIELTVIQGWKYGNYLSLIQTQESSEYKKESAIFFLP